MCTDVRPTVRNPARRLLAFSFTKLSSSTKSQSQIYVFMPGRLSFSSSYLPLSSSLFSSLCQTLPLLNLTTLPTRLAPILVPIPVLLPIFCSRQSKAPVLIV